ncbi:hypothetical protein, partial [Lysinibacillus odysseyi]|uniref:hypothetical protein n=1 Tax=Lysinibacillus odysseyi TaxID=202611 RepID=UPI001C3F9207
VPGRCFCFNFAGESKKDGLQRKASKSILSVGGILRRIIDYKSTMMALRPTQGFFILCIKRLYSIDGAPSDYG